MSCWRMMVKGPKSACSNVARVLGFACTTNLGHVRQLNALHNSTLSAHLNNAEMLSKIYWSKFGLLGFFEMTPKIATSLCRRR